MSILLTGGLGYIGSHTAVELISRGYDIVVVDNCVNSSRDMVDKISQVANTSIKHHLIDVSDVDELNTVFSKHSIEGVIHFAGFKSVSESVRYPRKYYSNNIGTALALLEVCERNGIKRVVFSSSASVYGNPLKVPIEECDPVGMCTSPYGWTKYIIERILIDSANADEGLSIIILRYFNPIGAHESGLLGENPISSPDNLFPCITQTAAGLREYLSIYGGNYPTRDGTGIRDYIHVTDLAKGHCAAIEYSKTHIGAEILNLGTGKGYSVNEVIRTFEEVTGASVPTRILERRPGDISESYACVKKAELILGWRAEKTLEEMCIDAWRWQKNCSGTSYMIPKRESEGDILKRHHRIS